MSWKASAYVKELIVAPNGEQLTRSEKLLLLILADYYNDAQGCAWPSIPLLAAEAMLKVRRTQQLMRSIERKGVIITEQTAREDGGQGVNFYRFPELAKSARPPVQSLHPPGAISHAPPVQSRVLSPYIEQEVKPEGRTRGKSATTQPPFVVTPEMKKWAAKYPAVDLELETENFLDHHLSKGSKFKDWPAAWRTWIRNSATKFAPKNGSQAQLNRPGKFVH